MVYEDDVWLCANKPPFVRTAPRHRFEGNSMVNRAIGYVRGKSGAQDGPPQENPRVLHRLDMDTSGVLLYSKDRDVAAHVQGLFRCVRAGDDDHLFFCNFSIILHYHLTPFQSSFHSGLSSILLLYSSIA